MNTVNDTYKQLWDERYSNLEYAYGTSPNSFFKDQLDQLRPGRILLPAEGEGRNAVYAASRGWDVTAFDLSKKGEEKAIALAHAANVSINYLVGDVEQLNFKEESFDVIGLIYAHFLAHKKSPTHKKLTSSLKRNGIIIFEAFGKKNIPLVKANPQVGGAMEEAMLYSTAEIKEDFPDYSVDLLEEKEMVLEEGVYHNGVGSVVRFIGRKI